MENKIELGNKKLKSRKLLSILIVFFSLVVISLGTSIAYFAIIVKGNEEATNTIVSTAYLELEFIDGPEISMVGAYPGQYLTKTVHITNKSTKTVAYTLEMQDYINTFLNEEFVVSYTCTSYENYGGSTQTESGTCNPLPETVMTSASKIIDQGVQIESGITHEIIITFKFKETGSNQDENQGKTFAGKLNISDTGNAFTLVLQVVNNDETPIANADVEVHSIVRKGKTDENGVVEISNLATGTHSLIVKNSNETVMEGNFMLEASKNTSSVSGTTVVGKAEEEVVKVKMIKSLDDSSVALMEPAVISKLTLDLNGCTTSQTFSKWYPENAIITLTDPSIYDGEHAFSEWEVDGATLNEKTLTVGNTDMKLKANIGLLPVYISYTGTMGIGSTLSEAQSNKIVNSTYKTSDENWQIYFLTSGTLTINSIPSGTDIFAVGGGGSGGKGGCDGEQTAGGGGGGYTKTEKNVLLSAGDISVTIGGSGGTTLFGTYISAAGGGSGSQACGGSGGSGGGASSWRGWGGTSGGSNGNGTSCGGGQGTTTRAFGEEDGELYAGGGAGGARYIEYGAAAGGAGGGGTGAGSNHGAYAGAENTGGGGGGGCSNYNCAGGASGGSGVVIIRNTKKANKN